MSFSAQLNGIVDKTRRQEAELYRGCVNHAFRSIRFGSKVTGAPGQPVDTQALLDSWVLKYEAGRQAYAESSLFYAPIIEDNKRGAQLRSKVGGFHSVKLTRVGWNRIVQYELQNVKAGRGGTPDPGAAPLRIRTSRRRDRRGRFVGNKTRLDFGG